MPRRSPESHEPLASPVFVSEPDRTKPPSPEVPEDLRVEHDRLMSEYLPLKAKHDAFKAGTGERPTLPEYKRITALAQGILDTRKGRAPLETEPTSELHEHAKELAKELSRELTARAREFGQTMEYTIRPPELPPDLTEAHLAAVREALGSGAGFAERVLPALADLNDLDETYTDAMYPKEQSQTDKDRGLVSYRPSWWKDKSDKNITKTAETWGEAFTRSMRQELENVGGSLILIDTALKPKDLGSGRQHYGTTEGNDPNADPLLPLFREAFGSEANRFNHSWDDLETKLIPLAEKKIKDELKFRGLKEVSFKVMLVPATLDNIELTLNTPQSSTTDTWEWTSTQLKDGENNDTGHRLYAGRSVDGGAGSLGDGHRSRSDGDLGARLAVVFKKLDTDTRT